ncbi:replication initiator protein A [Lacticaseibacillus paracasei]|uniref:replication initiator protein A n=1 Tax=Lacticaseibacillus paracasei TaxID=1597 RepID=UPI0021A9A58A|nr:replication initiator protein A [Lacticaseibacillus paracasei]MCT4394895.1 plasmid replication initiation protein [Lacticaseibacillus paracasei]
MIHNNFYKAQEVYGETYYQLLRVFFTSPKYKTMSNDAKVAFSLLKDRFKYSVKNNWIDEDGRLYFVYTNKELMTVLNCREGKLSSIKKELINANLLMQKRMGINQPNRLYLLRPDVSSNDIYQQEKDLSTLNQGDAIFAVPVNVDKTGNAEIARPLPAQKTNSQTPANSGNAKIAHNLYKDLDINTRDNEETGKLDFSTNQYSPEIIQMQNQDLVQNAKTYLPESTTGGLFLNKEGVELLGLWCRSPKQMHRFLGIILNAKKAVEREHEGTTIVLDDPQCQEMINKTMRRYFNVLRSDSKKINNVENYLFGAMKETLVAYWNKSLMTANGGDPDEF